MYHLICDKNAKNALRRADWSRKRPGAKEGKRRNGFAGWKGNSKTLVEVINAQRYTRRLASLHTLFVRPLGPIAHGALVKPDFWRQSTLGAEGS